MSLLYTIFSTGATANYLANESLSVNNPIWFSFSSKIDGTAAIKPYATVKFDSTCIQNNSITINDIVYECKNNPSWGQWDNGNPATSSESFYWCLSDDARINYKYDFQWDNIDTVTIISKEANPLFNLDISTNWSGITINNTISYTDRRDQNYSNWSLLMQLYKNDTKWGNYQTIFDDSSEFIVTIERQYQKDNIYNFNLESIYNKLLETDIPTQSSYENVGGWETQINYKLAEAWGTTLNGYKTKRLIAEGFNHWVFNTALPYGESFDINNYISIDTPFIGNIQFNIGLFSGNTITLNYLSGQSSTFMVEYPIAITTNRQLGIIAGNFITWFNNQPQLSGWTCTRETTASTLVTIQANNIGTMWDMTFNADSQFFTWTITNSVDGAPCLDLNKRLTTRGGIGEDILTYFYIQDQGFVPYVAIKRKVTYYNNTTEDFYTDWYQITDYGLQKIKWNTFIPQVNKKIKWIDYSVWTKATNSATPTQWTQEKRHYIIENDEMNTLNEVNLIWQNSLGTFDNWTFRGEETVSYEIEKKTYNKWKPFGWTPSDGSLAVVSSEARKTSLIRSYWMLESEMEWVKELFWSKRVFRLVNDTYEAQIVSSPSWEFNQNDGMWKCEFSLINSVEENGIK